MRILLRKVASRYLPATVGRRIKDTEYRLKKLCVSVLPSLNRNQLCEILRVKLRIGAGDNLFVHASMDMINTNLSPLQLLDLLLELIGPQGSITVPTFPRHPAAEWMGMDVPFDVRKTPSGMGVFSERVRRHRYAKRSVHPTKPVATIGPIAEHILSKHHLDARPFGPNSPFYRLLGHNVKVVGLGVPMSYLSMVHTVEDCNPEAFPREVHRKGVLTKTCVFGDGSRLDVRTLVHDLVVQARADPEKFCRKYMDGEQFLLSRHYVTPFFVVNGKALYDALLQQMNRGVTIYD